MRRNPYEDAKGKGAEAMTFEYSRHVSIWDEATNARKFVEVKVQIDLVELARELARRTNRSKSGKSCIHGNIIIATQTKETTK